MTAGMYVSSSGKDFVPEDTNGNGPGSGDGIDAYVRDMQTGEFTLCNSAARPPTSATVR